MTQDNKKLAVYQARNGAIALQIDCDKNTIWANINEIAELFDINKSNVSRHIKNIFEDEELVKIPTVARYATVEKLEGRRVVSRTIEYYSLDVILTIGYRARSAKKAIEFRKWATKTLKQHITKGFTINPKQIKKNHKEFLKAIENIKELSEKKPQIRTSDVLELVKAFSATWFSLESYDKQQFPKKRICKKIVGVKAEDLYKAVAKLKEELIKKGETTELFAQEKTQKSLEGILGNVFQTVFGNDAYPSLEEKAIHLLYFIIKDHPFTDGNKRTGAFAFIWFLQQVGIPFENKITPETLTALALLVAESNPKEKEKIIGLLLLLLTDEK